MEIEKQDVTSENIDYPQELKARDEKIAGLEKTLAERDAAAASMQKSLDEAKQAVVEASVDLSEAVAAYRQMTVAANPGLVAEMIKGNTIGEINASLKTTKELIAKVKQEVGAENARVRVPAGAPQRTSPDLSGLSAREKIRYGVGSSNRD